jgi:CRISPR-associated protein Cmr5
MTVATTGPTLDQRRAAHAWKAIDRLPEADRKAIQRAAKKLPMRILTAGLGHALLFVKVKDKAPSLLSDLSQWVLLERHAKPGQSGADLLAAIINGNADDLRRHMVEAIAWLAWFNRFAEAKFGAAEETGDAEP